MNIKMLKDSSWQIKGKIRSFKNDEEKTSEEIGDDSIVKDMLRLDYAVEVTGKKMVKEYENKAIKSDENKAFEIKDAPKKRGRKPKRKE